MTTLPDMTALKALLADAAAADWRDDSGNTLLHHAARLGDTSVVEACLERGISAVHRNASGETAADIARAWDYPTVADVLDLQAKVPSAPLAYVSLQEIRAASTQKGYNVLCDIVNDDRFEEAAALIIKNNEKLTVDDLLAAGRAGNSALISLCEKGQLKAVLETELWGNNASVLLDLWRHVPRMYQMDIDIQSYVVCANREMLRSSAPKWRGFRR